MSPGKDERLDGDGEAKAAYELGDRLAANGDLAGAERAYREADESGHAAAAAKLGLLLESGGRREDAQAAYARADQRGSGFGAFKLGVLLAGADDWEQAKAAWARADQRGKEVPGLDLEAWLRRHEHAASSVEASAVPRSALANPVLVGAMTVLVIMVAVFLAYNANNGLPFVPTKQLKVDIASGADLVAGNETDKLDSRTLAVLLWKGELDAVWMPDERCRILRRRLARREQLMRTRTRAKNEIQAVLQRRLQGKAAVR